MDPRRLRPIELVRLLNSTPLGAVLGETAVRRQLARAGWRVGDGRRIDLLRYVAFLIDEMAKRKRQSKTPPAPAAGYAKHREQMGARSRERSRKGRDIGPLPPVADAARRAAAEDSLRAFLETYHAETFSLAWSPDHLKILDRAQQAIDAGGLFAVAMPRGWGKTAICLGACEWAAVTGRRPFGALIASDKDAAVELLSQIKEQLETNDLLAADFPEVCCPLRALEGNAGRAAGQLCLGQRTRIRWGRTKIVLPTIAGSRASGAILRVSGLQAGFRGMRHVLADGRTIRPSLVILDDPQTDRSARSPQQTATRERIVSGAMLGLAGMGQPLAAVAACTVIQQDDLADRLLDPKRNPRWNGLRCRMLYAPPAAENLWEEYARLRAENQTQATEFYRGSQAAMDAGAKPAWPERFDDDEISALQHAMNLKIDDPIAFAAEQQQEPLPDTGTPRLTAEQIAAKLSGLPGGTVPKTAQHVTAFIDVHDRLLYWMVCAFDDDFTGSAVAYGTHPKQHLPHFAAGSARQTLAQQARGAGIEGAIRKGLDLLVPELLLREWPREGGGAARIGKLLVDAGYKGPIVREFCRRSSHAALLMPSIGKFVGASSVPFGDYRPEPGAKRGFFWRLPPPRNGERHVLGDVNFWKSFWIQGLGVPLGDRGCLTLFGRDARAHLFLGEHFTSEFPKKTTSGTRSVEEWKLRPGHSENHWFDCAVGCAVAASMLGATLPGTACRAARRRVRMSDLQAGRVRHE